MVLGMLTGSRLVWPVAAMGLRVNAPALIQFWEENFKLQVGARSMQPVEDLQGMVAQCCVQAISDSCSSIS